MTSFRPRLYQIGVCNFGTCIFDRRTVVNTVLGFDTPALLFALVADCCSTQVRQTPCPELRNGVILTIELMIMTLRLNTPLLPLVQHLTFIILSFTSSLVHYCFVTFGFLFAFISTFVLIYYTSVSSCRTNPTPIFSQADF